MVVVVLWLLLMVWLLPCNGVMWFSVDSGVVLLLLGV